MPRAARLTASQLATPDDLANTLDPPSDRLVTVPDLILWLRTNSEAQAEICRIVREEFGLGGQTATPPPNNPQPQLDPEQQPDDQQG